MKILANKPDQQQQYNNPFKEQGIYPFSKIGRVACNKDTGAIVHWLDENDSSKIQGGGALENSNNQYDIFTYIPKFYCKREWQGEVLKDSISTEIPTTAQKGEWEVHPVFLREDGTIRDYILVGSFLGTEVEGQLRSIASGQKPLVSNTMAQFRDKARQGRDNKFNIMSVEMLSCLQLLYKIAFQDLNAQNVIGNGWAGKSESATVGNTVQLGNKSGYLDVNGNQISFLGIEDFYGNIWQFIDGFYIKDDGYYVTNDVSKFGGLSSTFDKIASTPLTSGTDNQYIEGYIKNIEQINGKHKFLNIPKSIGGASNTFYSDYVWSHRKTQENIFLFGARWNSGAHSGAFCCGLHIVASNSWSYVGARLCYLP